MFLPGLNNTTNCREGCCSGNQSRQLDERQAKYGADGGSGVCLVIFHDLSRNYLMSNFLIELETNLELKSL